MKKLLLSSILAFLIACSAGTATPQCCAPPPTPTPVATPTPTPTPVPDLVVSTVWEGEVYAGVDPVGTVVSTRQDADPLVVSFCSTCFPTGITARPFAIRWRGVWDFETGTHRFTARTDDGIRVFVDGVNLIDSWIQQSATIYVADIELAAGLHEVIIEYNDVAGIGVAEVSHALATAAPGPTPTPTPTPPPGSIVATKVVSTTGSDATNCQVATPCRTIARATQVAVAGDIVLVKAGSYSGDATVANSGTSVSPIIFVAEAPGTVIYNGHIRPATWPGDHGFLNSGGQQFITIRGFVFRTPGDPVDTNDPSDPANDCQMGATQVRATIGWRLENNIFEKGRTGLNVRGHDVVIDGNIFQDLDRFAFVGAGSDTIFMRGPVITKNIIRRINEIRVMKPRCAAITKILKSTGVIFDGNESHDNVGPGFWLDHKNLNYVISNNIIRNNKGRDFNFEGPGIWTEINAGPGIIENNTITSNTGAAVGILETSDVIVRNNTFTDNGSCVELRRLKRFAGQPELRNISIVNNHCDRWRSGGMTTSGGSAEFAGWNPMALNVVINRNHYTKGLSGTIFRWLGVSYTSLAQVRSALGFEINGTGG